MSPFFTKRIYLLHNAKSKLAHRKAVKMRKHIAATILFISIIVLLRGSALGGLIHLALDNRSFNDLFSGPENAIGTPMVTSVTGGDVQGNVVSQAFTDGNGHYAYLYQLNNTGGEQNDVFQAFTNSPFVGADAEAIVGCLTSGPPAGFTLGDQAPYGATLNLKAGPTISFSFTDLFYCAIDPGESSNTLYVLSNNAPGVIIGNVIDGYAHSGGVVGPVGPVVPEPTTASLLAGFCVAILAYCRRAKRGQKRSLLS
jgi:hypothetical protein